MQLPCKKTMAARPILLSVLFVTLCFESNAYPYFKAKIPNGDSVPNPCNRSTIWSGVGHQSSFGSGPRNPFGLDFKANNYTWNSSLCQKDSDGDGLTNGQELGDPNCIWTEGSTPTFSTNLSHPGICEPIGLPLCSRKNSWLMNCKPEKFNCPSINGSDVRNTTLRFPVTPVPTKETTYICHQVTFPNDSVSDIIAVEPVLDNPHILHHILFFGCSSQPQGNPAGDPFECGMGTESCMALIGFWFAGITGQCLSKEYGYRIGPGGFQYGIVQIHWNNPEHKINQTDSSGMRIYYTSELRPNRGQVVIVAQKYLEIPPGQKEVTLTGKFASACTKKMPQSIFIKSAFLHMHSLGKSGDIIVSRNGNVLRVLDNATEYDYNAPSVIEFENPIEVRPGDEIQVKCVYQSTTRNSTTYFGEATSAEMCYAFLAYYPLLEGLSFCGQWKNINICNLNYQVEFEPCDLNTVMKLITFLPKACAENCTSTPCAVIMDGIYATGCHNYPDVKLFLRAFMHSNTTVFEKCEMERPPTPPPTTPQCAVSNSPGQGVSTMETPRPGDLLNTVSNSSGQGVSIGFGLVLALISYAAYY